MAYSFKPPSPLNITTTRALSGEVYFCARRHHYDDHISSGCEEMSTVAHMCMFSMCEYSRGDRLRLPTQVFLADTLCSMHRMFSFVFISEHHCQCVVNSQTQRIMHCIHFSKRRTAPASDVLRSGCIRHSDYFRNFYFYL